MHNRSVTTIIPGSLTACSPAQADGRSKEPIDAEHLARLRRDCDSPGAPLSDELLELYMHELEPRINAIRDALNHRDAVALARAAHALKGSSALIGAQSLAELCLQLETAGRSVAIAPARSLLTRLEQEAIRVRQALGFIIARSRA